MTNGADTNEKRAKRIEIIATVILAFLEVGTAIAEIEFNYRPRGWVPVLGVFLAFFILTSTLILTNYYYPRRLVRVLTIPLIVVGAVATVFFLTVGSVLFVCRFIQKERDERGFYAGSHEGGPIRVDPATLTGDYKFRFEKNADYAEIYVRPAESDKDRVRSISLINFALANRDDQDKFQHNKLTEQEEEFRVQKPSASLNAAATYKVSLSDNAAKSPVNLLSTYKYWRQDSNWWRIRTWALKEFDSY